VAVAMQAQQQPQQQQQQQQGHQQIAGTSVILKMNEIQQLSTVGMLLLFLPVFFNDIRVYVQYFYLRIVSCSHFTFILFSMLDMQIT